MSARKLIEGFGPSSDPSDPSDPSSRFTDAQIAEVVDRAEEAFWAVVADNFPEAISGDLDPGTVEMLKRTMRGTVRQWLRVNVSPSGG